MTCCKLWQTVRPSPALAPLLIIVRAIGSGISSFINQDSDIELREALKQKPLAQACADWIRRKVDIKAYQAKLNIVCTCNLVRIRYVSRLVCQEASML